MQNQQKNANSLKV